MSKTTKKPVSYYIEAEADEIVRKMAKDRDVSKNLIVEEAIFEKNLNSFIQTVKPKTKQS